MSNGILVFIEHKAGTLNKTSLEAIAAAQKLGGDTGQKVSAVLLGAPALAVLLFVITIVVNLAATSIVRRSMARSRGR